MYKDIGSFYAIEMPFLSSFESFTSTTQIYLKFDEFQSNVFTDKFILTIFV